MGRNHIHDLHELGSPRAPSLHTSAWPHLMILAIISAKNKILNQDEHGEDL